MTMGLAASTARTRACLEMAFDFFQRGGIGLRQVSQRWGGGEPGTLAGPTAGEP
jgi:hypothetical protein